MVRTWWHWIFFGLSYSGLSSNHIEKSGFSSISMQKTKCNAWNVFIDSTFCIFVKSIVNCENKNSRIIPIMKHSWRYLKHFTFCNHYLITLLILEAARFSHSLISEVKRFTVPILFFSQLYLYNYSDYFPFWSHETRMKYVRFRYCQVNCISFSCISFFAFIVSFSGIVTYKINSKETSSASLWKNLRTI